MRLLSFLVCLVVCVVADPAADSGLKCDYTLPSITQAWIHMTDPCVKAIKTLINRKINTSVQYLALANYYLQDSVNRPGYGNLFMKGAYKERSTAIELIDYLLMRGQDTRDHLINIPLNLKPPVTTWTSLVQANEYVLAFEGATTDLYYNVIGICEKQPFSDYHVTNYFSHYFLLDQLDNMKYYADRTSQLKKMFEDHKNFGEFLSDTTMHFAIIEDEEDEDDDDDE